MKTSEISKEHKELAASYLEHRMRLGYAEKGCKSLYNYLLEFLGWMERYGVGDVRDANASHIRDYESYLRQRPNKVIGGQLTEKSIYTHLKNASDFFEMLCANGGLESNPCAGLEIARPRDNASRTALSRAETELIYAAAETGKERAILAMGYGCGLRVGEMVACNVEDVNLRDGILIVPRGKGNKRRAVPMSGGVKEALSEYLHNERFSREKAFMLNERGRRMRKWTYNHRLQEIIERTGDQALIGKRITTHHLRHSIATHLLESGVDVKQVQLFLGHYHLETTQVYTHISQKQLEKLTL